MKQILFLVLLGLVACKTDDDNNNGLDGCDTTTSDFQLLYQDALNAGANDDNSYDTEIHEYTFTLSANQVVCGIGYQSQPAIQASEYLIEIVDNATTSIVYSGLHTFDSASTSYDAPVTAVSLDAGVSYSIRRTVTYADVGISNTIGRIARLSPASFPYTNGVMTITSTNCYQGGGPLLDLAIPYLDIVFE